MSTVIDLDTRRPAGARSAQAAREAYFHAAAVSEEARKAYFEALAALRTAFRAHRRAIRARQKAADAWAEALIEP